MLNWATIGEERFNRAVEMLVMLTVEADNPGLKVTAVNGRGGDGGIDLDVTVRSTGQLVTIYQLKHFPDGFSGNLASGRKRQIRDSFDAAVKHDPEKWVLVIPNNFTPGERKFVTALKGKRSKPHIERIGVTELDVMLRRFPEVEDYIRRDETRATLDEVKRGSALLSKPDDLIAEMRQMEKRLKARSLYWGANFGKIGHTYYEELVALRPDAAEREPLRIDFTADFTSDLALRDELERALDFGLFEPLSLPAGVITHFERVGPEWFAGVLEVLGIDLMPTDEDLDIPVKVILRSAEGKTLAQPVAARARVASGRRGGQLKLAVVDGVEFTFFFDKENVRGGELTYEVNLVGLSGAQTKRAMTFLTALADAAQLTVEPGNLPPFTVAFGDHHADHPDEKYTSLADDLAYIEDELGVTFSIPEDGVGTRERVWARVIRHTLKGMSASCRANRT